MKFSVFTFIGPRQKIEAVARGIAEIDGSGEDWWLAKVGYSVFGRGYSLEIEATNEAEHEFCYQVIREHESSGDIYIQ